MAGLLNYTPEQLRQMYPEGAAPQPTLDPALIAQLKALWDQNGQFTEAGGGDAGPNYQTTSIPGLEGFPLNWEDRTTMTGGGTPTDPSKLPWEQGRLSQPVGGRWIDNYDTNGNFIDRELGNSGWVDIRESYVKPAAYAAAMYFGGQGLAGLGGAGAGGAGGAGAGGAGGLTAADLAVSAPSLTAEGLAGSGVYTAGAGAGGGGLLAGGGAAGGLEGLGGFGSISSTADLGGLTLSSDLGGAQMLGTGGGGMLGSGVSGATGGGLELADLAKYGKTASSLLGAAAGAASSKDQTQTSSRDPWEPAQPFIKANIDSTAALQKQYQANPFSADQQTALSNILQTINGANAAAPSLWGGMNANASGANNFDRLNPRRSLIGNSTAMPGYAPGLLNGFPKG